MAEQTLPFDIIMNVVKMRPRDSAAKSPTSDCINEEFDDLLAHIRFLTNDLEQATTEAAIIETMQTLFVKHLFFFYRMNDDFKQRHQKIRPRDKDMKSPTSKCIKKLTNTFQEYPVMFDHDFRVCAFAFLWEGQGHMRMRDWDIAVQNYKEFKSAFI